MNIEVTASAASEKFFIYKLLLVALSVHPNANSNTNRNTLYGKSAPPAKTPTVAVVSQPQQRIKLTASANSDGWLLVFDAFTSSGHQLMNGPADHFLTINPTGVHVFADFSPCPFQQAIRLTTR